MCEEIYSKGREGCCYCSDENGLRHCLHSNIIFFLRWKSLMYSRLHMWYIPKDDFELLILQISWMVGLQVCHTSGNLILFCGPNPGLHAFQTSILEAELYLQFQILLCLKHGMLNAAHIRYSSNIRDSVIGTEMGRSE